MLKKFLVPRGTSDILPDEIFRWQEVESEVRNLLRVYGYKEIRTPIFEETDLFVRSMGQTSDVVQKQMLTLQSQKKSDADDIEIGGLSLRPEGTAPIVRSYIQNDLDKKESLSKLFYIGPMFRGERPQKGRLRQFHQIGVEAIGPGTSSPYLDAEVIALSVNILKVLDIKHYRLKINTLGALQDKENFSKFLRQKLKPNVSNLCEDCQKRFERNVFRILDCKNKTCKLVVDQLELGSDYLSEESRRYFAHVREALDSLNIEYEQSFKLVRGLDYYTHTVFEISDSSLGSQDALGAGGRYNNLVSDLGGPQVDSVGFALGMERILLAMPKETMVAKSAVNVYIIALDEISLKRAFQILNILRSHEISSDMTYRISSLKSQMRLADKVGARYVMILGENEIKKGVVTLKDMQTGTQREEKVDNLSKITQQLIEKQL